MKVVDRLFGTEPVILHAAGPLNLSPLWGSVEQAFSAAPPSDPVGARDDYTFFTWNSGARRSHDRGEEAWNRRTLPPPARRAARGTRSRHQPVWTNIMKIMTLRNALVGVDRPTSSPAILQMFSSCEIRACVDLFEELGADVVYIGDPSFWPPEFEDLKSKELRVPGARGMAYPYLNAGALIGAGTSDDDQSIMKRLYLEHHPRVQVDFRCRIFQPLT